MKIIENSISCEWDRWDDPGDYPCGAGGGPLPSYSFPVIEGSLELEVEPTDDLDEIDVVDEYHDELYNDIPGGVSVKWKVERKDSRISIFCDEAEGEPERDYPEPDDYHDSYSDYDY